MLLKRRLSGCMHLKVSSVYELGKQIERKLSFNAHLHPFIIISDLQCYFRIVLQKSPGNGVNRYHNVSVVAFSPMYSFNKSERIMIPSSTIILNDFVAIEKISVKLYIKNQLIVS